MQTLSYEQSKQIEAKALAFLLEQKGPMGAIDKALLEWAADGAAYGLQVENQEALKASDWQDIFDNIQSMLESCNCAACSSPAPIYTHAMVQELAEVWEEVDEALSEYHDATGDNWQPVDYSNRKPGLLTVGALLWFAYEWRASQLASWLESERFADNMVN